MLLSLLVSCNGAVDGNTETYTDSNDDTQTSISTNTNTDIVEPLLPYEKYGNKVYFAFEEKDIYYSEIENYEEIESCFEIPLDNDGHKKSGAYMKIIGSYDELSTYIASSEIDASIFNSSYVVCVKQFFYDVRNEKRLIGYYRLELNGNEYSILLDYYRTVEQALNEQDLRPYEYTNYIIVPKSCIEYTDQIQQIKVNEKNDIEFDGKEEYQSHGYISFNEGKGLPENPTSWIVKKGSEIEKQYGFEYPDKYSGVEYRVVLYLPNEPSCDFMITEKEIKNGNLYLTVEKYLQYTNEYLNKNDVKFYDLHIEDSSELSENYDVYILVKIVK